MEITTVLVITSEHIWGKGSNLEEALKECHNEGSKAMKAGHNKKVDFIVYEFGDDIVFESLKVDGMGSPRWERKPDTTEEQGEPIGYWMMKKGERVELS